MDKIRTVIQELEKEQADLKRLIDAAIKDGEYLMAHFHSEAMGHVNRRLQTLRNLDDKAFDSKRIVKSMIKRFEVQLGLDYPEKLKDYIRKQIENLKQELQELNLQEKVAVPESTVLVEYLDSLISRKIRNVKIVLKKSSNFLLDIRRSRSGVKVLIPNLKSLRRNHLIHEENLPHFLGLGFVVDANDSRMTLLLIGMDRRRILMELKIIILKIVFEIFYFKEFEGETFIEIRE